MKIAIIAWFLIVALLIIGAVFLMLHDKSGWGWLLFIAFLMLCGFNYKEKENKDEKE